MDPLHTDGHVELANEAALFREQADLLDRLDGRAREMVAMEDEHRRWIADRFPEFSGRGESIEPLDLAFDGAPSIDADAGDLIAVMQHLRGDNVDRAEVPGELVDKQRALADRWTAAFNRDLLPADDHDITLLDDEPEPALFSHGRILASDTVRTFRWQGYQPFPGGANVGGKAIHRNQNEVGQFSRNGSMRGSGVPLMLANTVHTFRPRFFAVMGTTSLTGRIEMWVELEQVRARYASFVGGLPNGPDFSMVSGASTFTFFGARGSGASPTSQAGVRLWSDNTSWFRFSSNPRFNAKVTDQTRTGSMWIRIQGTRTETIRFDGQPSTIGTMSVGLLDTLAVADPTKTISYVSAHNLWKLKSIRVNLVH